MSGISHIEKLGTLRRRLQSFTKDGRAYVIKAAADEALTQTQLGFRLSRDPYGDPWKPLKRRRGKPLQDSSRLRNSFVARPLGDGFVIGSNVRYASYHQFGTRRIPQRAMLPIGTLGPIWGPPIRAAMLAALRVALLRGG